MALICDTGPLLASIDRDDPDHARCVSLIAGADEDLIVPTLVLAELDHLCRTLRLDDAWIAFLEDVATGAWRIEHPTIDDLARSRTLQETYRDLRLGVVDASVIALCERLGESKVATLDHRHFSVVRPVHVAALTLLPD